MWFLRVAFCSPQNMMLALAACVRAINIASLCMLAKLVCNYFWSMLLRWDPLDPLGPQDNCLLPGLSSFVLARRKASPFVRWHELHFSIIESPLLCFCSYHSLVSGLVLPTLFDLCHFLPMSQCHFKATFFALFQAPCLCSLNFKPKSVRYDDRLNAK